MSLKGLENAVQNLSSIDRQMIPKASAMTINRLAQKAISFATHKVAKETVAGDNHRQGIPFRLVKQRVRLWKASPALMWENSMPASVSTGAICPPLNSVQRRSG